MEKLLENNQLLVSFLSQLAQQDNFSEIIERCEALSKKQEQEQSNQGKQVLSNFESFVNNQYEQLSIDTTQVALSNSVKVKKVPRLYVDGVFDLMHSGHYNALRQAKQLTDCLVVGVVRHEDVCRRKGTPILSFEERLVLAKSCKFVDEIYEKCPYDADLNLLDQLNCTHIAHGDDLILTADGKDAYQPFKDAGRMLIFKRTEGISTTDIVGRLLLMSKRYSENNLVQNIRKMSGEQGIVASQIGQKDQVEEQKEQEQTQPVIQKKVKLLNTTRRIRQFSADHKEPKQGDKIVYIDGSYDLLHIGHIKTLEKAKSMGDYLIVGVHDDETINEVKGANYPILQLQERVLNVLAMKFVDEVIIGAPWKITEQMIKQFGVNLVVEGSLTKFKEHDQKEVQVSESEDPYAVPKKLGIYQQIQSESTMTTETIIERIVNNRLQYLEIYQRKAKKEENYYNQERKVQEC